MAKTPPLTEVFATCLLRESEPNSVGPDALRRIKQLAGPDAKLRFSTEHGRTYAVDDVTGRRWMRDGTHEWADVGGHEGPDMDAARTGAKPPGPKLKALIASGVVTLDDTGAYVAKAADGTEVQLGHETSDPKGIESYLTSYPGPQDW